MGARWCDPRLRNWYLRVFGIRFALLVRRETGEELRVKVSYGEGAAIHAGLESCEIHREVCSEALTEEVQASH